MVVSNIHDVFQHYNFPPSLDFVQESLDEISFTELMKYAKTWQDGYPSENLTIDQFLFLAFSMENLLTDVAYCAPEERNRLIQAVIKSCGCSLDQYRSFSHIWNSHV